MSLNKLTENLNYVSNLANQPTETADELKKVFDKSGNTLKEYINNSLLPEIDSTFMPYTGGTFKGNINTQNVIPAKNETYNLGSSVNTYKEVYANSLVQKVPVTAGSTKYTSHGYKFAWNENALRVAIDGDSQNIFLTYSMNHNVYLAWTGSRLGLYVDNKFIGYISIYT